MKQLRKEFEKVRTILEVLQKRERLKMEYWGVTRTLLKEQLEIEIKNQEMGIKRPPKVPQQYLTEEEPYYEEFVYIVQFTIEQGTRGRAAIYHNTAIQAAAKARSRFYSDHERRRLWTRNIHAAKA